MAEVYTSSQKDQTVWQPRPTDPELETEFLRRLMVKLGVSEAQAIAAATPVQAAAKVTLLGQQPVVQLDDDFDRAWRRVGLTLDRTGFTVEDRDRTQGVYFVRYVPTTAADARKPGFFGRLFSSSAPQATPAKYRVKVQSSGNSSTVSVLNEQGQPEASATAQRIVQLLADDLK
jgi:outer membrane protein assembly factor BamC